MNAMGQDSVLSHDAYTTEPVAGGLDFGGFGGDDVEDGAVGGDDVHICADVRDGTAACRKGLDRLQRDSSRGLIRLGGLVGGDGGVLGGELYAVGLAHRSKDNIDQGHETQASIARANTARTITPTLLFTQPDFTGFGPSQEFLPGGPIASSTVSSVQFQRCMSVSHAGSSSRIAAPSAPRLFIPAITLVIHAE
ncbi:hypothetical protein C8R44DRAFT_863302 [Mycena epipterygia]|nr:hypothetical protein C8R44DRAFT_863302 [Mycena epipterygia]